MKKEKPGQKHLSQLWLADARRRTPNYPDEFRIRPKFTDKNNRGLRVMIVTFLRLWGANVLSDGPYFVIADIGIRRLNVTVGNVPQSVKVGRQLRIGEVYFPAKDFESFYEWFCKVFKHEKD